jgi:hypothetical protein
LPMPDRSRLMTLDRLAITKNTPACRRRPS